MLKHKLNHQRLISLGPPLSRCRLREKERKRGEPCARTAHEYRNVNNSTIYSIVNFSIRFVCIVGSEKKKGKEESRCRAQRTSTETSIILQSILL